MKVFITLMSLVLATTSFAATNGIKCTLVSTAKKTQLVSASVSLDKADIEGAESEGLDIGKDNYSFYMDLTKLKNGYQVNVTFYENNNVQDEVGGMSCEFSARSTKQVICIEPITNDKDKTIAMFSCARI